MNCKVTAWLAMCTPPLSTTFEHCSSQREDYYPSFTKLFAAEIDKPYACRVESNGYQLRLSRVMQLVTRCCNIDVMLLLHASLSLTPALQHGLEQTFVWPVAYQCRVAVLIEGQFEGADTQCSMFGQACALPICISWGCWQNVGKGFPHSTFKQI